MHQYFIKFKKTDSWAFLISFLFCFNASWYKMTAYVYIWIAKNVMFVSFYRFNNILNAIGLLTVLELQNVSVKYENNYENIYKFDMYIFWGYYWFLCSYVWKHIFLKKTHKITKQGI